MKNNRLFSKERTETHDIYHIFGIKIAFPNKLFRRESDASKIIQNSLDLTHIINAKKLIVFLTPPTLKLNGGIMSIFSLCQASRDIVKDAFCCISTFPGKYTYIINDSFYNNERVLRFEQIINNAKKVQELILHIPEYYSKKFYKNLKKKDIKFLQSIPSLHINIMNQNIELMPEPNVLKDLYRLTNNITQTIAHNRYATQEVCDKWNIPTHLFSVNIDLSKYRTVDFFDKENIIVLSPDKNEYKDNIVEKLKKDFPNFEIITVQNMTFNEYMDLISRAYFTVTFGEGMDGYFTQPYYVNSIGFAVYNDKFFPDKSWENIPTLYNSYESMLENIADNMNKFLNNEKLYKDTINIFLEKHKLLYNPIKYKENLNRFYNKKYDFLPRQECISYAK